MAKRDLNPGLCPAPLPHDRPASLARLRGVTTRCAANTSLGKRPYYPASCTSNNPSSGSCRKTWQPLHQRSKEALGLIAWQTLGATVQTSAKQRCPISAEPGPRPRGLAQKPQRKGEDSAPNLDPSDLLGDEESRPSSRFEYARAASDGEAGACIGKGFSAVTGAL